MSNTWRWNPMLETGIMEVDRQHMELMDRVNVLLEAAKQDDKDYVMAETFIFLEEYVARHFSDEENLQIKYEYPGYNEHKALHEEFISNFVELRDRFTREGVTPALSLDLSKTLYEWLVDHIGTEDRIMAEFVKSKSK